MRWDLGLAHSYGYIIADLNGWPFYATLEASNLEGIITAVIMFPVVALVWGWIWPATRGTS